MKVTINVLCLLLIFTFYSCKKNNYESKSVDKPAIAAEAAPVEEYREEQNQITMKSQMSANDGDESKSKQSGIKEKSTELKIEKHTKIIKDGTLQLEVKNIENVKQAIDSIVKHHKAYYENDQFSNSAYESNYNLKIRIHSNGFDNILNEILNVDGVVKNKNINARDVTDEYYDTEARMNSAKKYLNRYYDLLTKAKNIKDIIEIEERIQNIQAEIDSYEGRLKYMNDQIDFSTLQLILTENHEYYNEITKEHFGKKIINAFKQGGDILLSTLLVLITLWPFILVLGVVLIYRRRILARFRK